MRRITFIICLGLLSLISLAQPRPVPPEKMNGEEIIRMQTSDIVSFLGLEGDTKDRFIREYTAFRKEIDAIFKNARPPKNMTDESEIDKAIQKNFEVSEQILLIRKKYYQIFKEFLSPSQIQTMYHIENEMGRRMRHGGPGGPGGPQGPEGGPNGPGGPENLPF